MTIRAIKLHRMQLHNFIAVANYPSVGVLGSPTALPVGVDGLVPVSIGEPGLCLKR